MDHPTQQFCTFHVDNLFLGIAVQQVQEVFRFQQMTRVPLAPGAVHGLINLRGQIVTAIDLRTRLGLPPRPTDRPPMNVVVRTDDGAITLLVDEIGDVQEVQGDTFERPPETLKGALRSLILGTYKLPDRLLLVLDTNQAVQLTAA
jgi:purine-binding chemotaxis protein CheW